jgi:hypothetical protein
MRNRHPFANRRGANLFPLAKHLQHLVDIQISVLETSLAASLQHIACVGQRAPE